MLLLHRPAPSLDGRPDHSRDTCDGDHRDGDHCDDQRCYGRYRVLGHLGTGWFADVFAAWDPALETQVALKVLSDRHAGDSAARRCLIDEARLLRRVRHPNVVTLHDVGAAPNGSPYLVMDLAAGGTVADRVAMGVSPDAHSVHGLARALAGGLGALHAAGIVHGDVKPSNVLVMSAFDQPDRFAVSDLGLAVDRRSRALPAFLPIDVNTGYRAPEQLSLREDARPESDVFGATAVLWTAINHDPPPSVRHLDWLLEDVTEPWRAVFLRGLAVSPSRRPRSMRDWFDAVDRALAFGLPAGRYLPATARW